ncbi:FAD-dependent oxidoreductase [Gracilibacillus halophilus YIM-C55.5]|uniref:FAD-dependent oxidoreductase n=1 Tax=Gracilibacillus halophilus YIM-C55.5 TaxID=1308866 RepID=N4WSJ8_9BACI|nr:YpdA family putative bacillithiol disulfide reductase [Gracilibacillus halophilus]ENH97360.1 FAD-dependent oxidoreductase [Gracilibacillus halophilus YIM-C55.5]
MQQEEVIIVGSGPCGMSAAIELQNEGFEPLIIEKGNIVHSIYQYPTHQTFFSSSDKLEIGDVAFVTEKPKPVRNQALSYYRTVAERQDLRINNFEEVVHIEKRNNNFYIDSVSQKTKEKKQYLAKFVVIATGYYGQPNYLGIKGENLNKVYHYFHEAHPYFKQDVVVIGGKNSAVDATLELYRAGANVTVLYRGSEYSASIKPWILPEFDSLVRKRKVDMIFEANILEIKEKEVVYEVNNEQKTIHNDFVFAMTGYQPNQGFLKDVGIKIDEETGRPHFSNETMETNVENVYIAGVIAAGYDNNEIFIENGRFHGGAIAKSIASKKRQ